MLKLLPPPMEKLGQSSNRFESRACHFKPSPTNSIGKTTEREQERHGTRHKSSELRIEPVSHLPKTSRVPRASRGYEYPEDDEPDEETTKTKGTK
jgi:hypothetical protein